LDRIVTTTPEVQMWEDARYERITYYKYIQAWVLCINKLYGFNGLGKTAFVNKIKSVYEFNKIQEKASVSAASCILQDLAGLASCASGGNTMDNGSL